MKRILCLLAVFAALGWGGWQLVRYPVNFRTLTDRTLSAAETERIRETVSKNPERKTLIAVFSSTGRTAKMADEIARQTGGDVFHIEKAGGYSNVYWESYREIASGVRPAIAAPLPEISAYDVIFVGYPIWWHATPAPIYTFLADDALRGKLVIPFATSVSSPIEETMPTFRDAAAGMAVYGEKRLTDAKEIGPWLEEIIRNS